MIVNFFKRGFMDILFKKRDTTKEQTLFARFNFSQGYECVQISSETADQLRIAVENNQDSFEFESLAKSKRWINLAKVQALDFYEADRIFPKKDGASEWIYIRLSENIPIDLNGCGSGFIEKLRHKEHDVIAVGEQQYVRRSAVLFVGYWNAL